MSDGNRRRGFVGLMVTLALGAAVGAAVLVVGREIARSGSARGPDQVARLARSRQGQLAVAAQAYVRAKESYDEALARKAPELSSRRETMLRARALYERLIMATTPGMVSLGAVPLPMNPVPMPLASDPESASGSSESDNRGLGSDSLRLLHSPLQGSDEPPVTASSVASSAGRPGR